MQNSRSVLRFLLFFGRGLSQGDEVREDSQNSYVFREGFGFCFSCTLNGVSSICVQSCIKMIFPDFAKCLELLLVSEPGSVNSWPPDILQLSPGLVVHGFPNRSIDQPPPKANGDESRTPPGECTAPARVLEADSTHAQFLKPPSRVPERAERSLAPFL
jgi:hypothetical protein